MNDRYRVDDAFAVLYDTTLQWGDLVGQQFALQQFRNTFDTVEQDRSGTMKVALVFGDEPGRIDHGDIRA